MALDMESGGGLDAFLQGIAKTKKYAALSEDLVRRIALEEGAKYKKEKQVVKAIKNRLHMITGAFSSGQGFASAQALLSAQELVSAQAESPEGASLSALALALMRLHVSTAERLPHLQAFYGHIFARLPAVSSLLDIGCGLNPCALAAVPHPPIARYTAVDIDRRIVETVERFFALSGQSGQAYLLDAVAGTPAEAADAALLLKVLPVLDAQRRGRGLALLSALRTRYAVVTFPSRSLSGREKGMEGQYAALYEPAFAEAFHILDKRAIGPELVYVLKRAGG